ncbi:MAG: transketolase [Bacillota bacterium]
MEIANLEAKAKELRRHIVSMLAEAGSGHPGGSLSAADLVTALYYEEMQVKPEDPAWEGRDYFVMSKGHAAPALYGILAMKGYFPVEDLQTLRKLGSHLQGHPCRLKTPGVEVSTGSLGHGVSVAAGIAKGLKLDNKENRVYTIVGDGESQEGQVWEAAMFAAHYKLDNFVLILDRNRLQIDGRPENVMNPEPLPEKFKAFGFNVIEIDGHNMEEILAAFAKARECKGMPTAIVANTIKGKGVSFMEDQVGWHGAAPKAEEAAQALAELA